VCDQHLLDERRRAVQRATVATADPPSDHCEVLEVS
jgi:hypothetical protein